MAREAFKPPAWALWPPMRVLPKDKKMRKAVIEKWANLILDWASKERKVLVDVLELSRTPPFDLPEDLFNLALEFLVKTGRAKWREPGKSLVLFWRSIDSWARFIYSWLKENFKEIFSIQDLMEADEEFSQLPLEELRACLRLLEKSGLVRRLRRVKGYYKLVVLGVPG